MNRCIQELGAGLFDSHTHLDAEEFDQDRESVIQRARAAGVAYLLTVGVGRGLGSARAIKPLIESDPHAWGSVGVHPHDAALELNLDELEQLAAHPKILAIGETGLDFYRDWSPRAAQEEWFRSQVALALKIRKPLIIHSRNAGAECLKILTEMHAEDVGGVFHCFAEDETFAAALRELNFMISITGAVTFKKAATLHQVAKCAPLEQIMLETDAPYIAPVPHRGKRCESAFLLETAKAVAALRGMPLEEIARQTTSNAFKLFRIKV